MVPVNSLRCLGPQGKYRAHHRANLMITSSYFIPLLSGAQVCASVILSPLGMPAVTFGTLCLVLRFSLLLPLQAAPNSDESTGRGGARAGRCVVRSHNVGDLFSPPHPHTCCVPGSKVAQWPRTQPPGSHRAVFES